MEQLNDVNAIILDASRKALGIMCDEYRTMYAAYEAANSTNTKSKDAGKRSVLGSWN